MGIKREEIVLWAILSGLVYVLAVFSYVLVWTVSGAMSYWGKVAWLASDPQAMARTVVSLNIFGGAIVTLIFGGFAVLGFWSLLKLRDSPKTKKRGDAE